MRAEVNCFNSTRCVEFTKTSISCRKLADQDIHEIATHEGIISDIYDRKWYFIKSSLQVSTSFPCVCLGCFLDLYTRKAYFQFVPRLDLIFFLSIIIVIIIIIIIIIIIVVVAVVVVVVVVVIMVVTQTSSLKLNLISLITIIIRINIDIIRSSIDLGKITFSSSLRLLRPFASKTT